MSNDKLAEALRLQIKRWRGSWRRDCNNDECAILDSCALEIEGLLQAHAAEATHTRIPDLTDDEWMILFHERPDLKDRLNAIFDKAAYLSRYRSQCKTSTEAAQAQPQATEPVEAIGCLSIRRFRGCDSMVNHDFDYFGSLPDGDYRLYTHPQSPPQAAEPVRQFRVVPEGLAWTDVRDPEIWASVVAHPESYETRVLYANPQPLAQDAKDAAHFDKKRFESAPCYLCGYNGCDYYQPCVHKCAALYHAAMAKESGR